MEYFKIVSEKTFYLNNLKLPLITISSCLGKSFVH